MYRLASACFVLAIAFYATSRELFVASVPARPVQQSVAPVQYATALRSSPRAAPVVNIGGAVPVFESAGGDMGEAGVSVAMFLLVGASVGFIGTRLAQGQGRTPQNVSMKEDQMPSQECNAVLTGNAFARSPLFSSASGAASSDSTGSSAVWKPAAGPSDEPTVSCYVDDEDSWKCAEDADLMKDCDKVRCINVDRDDSY